MQRGVQRLAWGVCIPMGLAAPPLQPRGTKWPSRAMPDLPRRVLTLPWKNPLGGTLVAVWRTIDGSSRCGKFDGYLAQGVGDLIMFGPCFVFNGS